MADGSILPTHDELLFHLATTPKSLEVIQRHLNQIVDLRKQKLALVAQQKADSKAQKKMGGKNGTLSNSSFVE